MAKYVLTAALVVSSIAIVLAFIGPNNPYVETIWGNYYFSRGDFIRATVHYLKAKGAADFESYLLYNLGNAYHSLGEGIPAVDTLGDARRDTDDPGLLSRVFFNLGNISFDNGQFAQAVGYYVEALRAVPNDPDTKTNLELALRKIRRPVDDGTALPRDAPSEESRTGEQVRQILEYILRREARPWASSQDTTEDKQDYW